VALSINTIRITPLPSTVISLAPASLAARSARAMSACVTLAGRRGITLSTEVRSFTPLKYVSFPTRADDHSKGAYDRNHHALSPPQMAGRIHQSRNSLFMEVISTPKQHSAVVAYKNEESQKLSSQLVD